MTPTATCKICGKVLVVKKTKIRHTDTCPNCGLMGTIWDEKKKNIPEFFSDFCPICGAKLKSIDIEEEECLAGGN